MSVIYKTSGRAAEYAPYAITLYRTCPHGCRYCFVPSTPPWRKLDPALFTFNAPAVSVPNVYGQLLNQVTRSRRAPAGTVLISFMSDPYPNRFLTGHDEALTRMALNTIAESDLAYSISILTKGGLRAVADFDILERRNWWFGQTVIFTDDDTASHPDCPNCPHNSLDRPAPTLSCLETESAGACPLAGWEPHAASWQDREAAFQIAHDLGIPTWCSIEPVISPDQAIEVIWRLIPYVDHFKIGKLNGRDDETRRIEHSIDWAAFLDRVQHTLRAYDRISEPGRYRRGTYYIKNDLVEAAS